MSTEAEIPDAPKPSTYVEGTFIRGDQVVGTFKGLMYSDDIKVDGHGEGSYAEPTEADRDAPVLFSTPGLPDVQIERLRSRRGLISFIAWHSQK